MQRNCPHCNVMIQVKVQPTQPRWVFARCPSCKATTLVENTASAVRNQANAKTLHSTETSSAQVATSLTSGQGMSMGRRAAVTFIFVCAFATIAAPLYWNQLFPSKPQTITLNDQLPSSQSAPLSTTPTPTASATPVVEPIQREIQVRVPSAILRSGPGPHFNVVGSAKSHTLLNVKSENEYWFEVETHHKKAGLVVSDPKSVQTAWIRKDLIQ